MEVRARATGSGIPEQDLPPGVEHFGLSDKAGLGELGGTGLGLSIGQWIHQDVLPAGFSPIGMCTIHAAPDPWMDVPGSAMQPNSSYTSITPVRDPHRLTHQAIIDGGR